MITLAEYIKELQAIEAEHGGNIPVIIETLCDYDNVTALSEASGPEYDINAVIGCEDESVAEEAVIIA